MKALLSLSFGFLFLIQGLHAQTTTKIEGDSKVIILPENNGRILEPKVFVESGTAIVAGSPEGGMKPAYRTWEQKCESLENKLSRNNGKNLMIFDCGEPQKTVETHQSESIYTYKSKATYKIRVIGK